LEDEEDLQELEKVLNKDTILQHSYQKEFEKLSNDIQKVMNSEYPIRIKMEMLQAIKENLKTKSQSLAEINQNTKDMIISLEKISSHSSYLESTQRWSNLAKNTSLLLTNTTNFTENSGSKASPSFLSNSPKNFEFLEEEQKMLKEMQQENERMEELIVNLKQTRNMILINIENSKDSAEEYQQLYQERKRAFEHALKRIEELKLQISIQSMTKGRSENLIFSPKGSEINKTVYPKGNQSMLQDVSNRVSSFMNKIFKKKKEKDIVNTERVLSPDFLNELNLHTAPDITPSPKELDLITKNFQSGSTKHLRR